jgi:Fe-S cluster assembly protein SufD
MSTPNTEYVIPELAPALERGPLWLREKRQSSRESFNSTPLPRRGLHLWRYTDPSKFVFEQSTAVDTPYDDNYDTAAKVVHDHLAEGHLAGLVSDFGGRDINCHVTEDVKKQGVIVSSLSDAAEKQKEIVEQYLYGLVNSETGKFEAMNGALWNDGIFIYIPDNVAVERPIHLLRESGQAGSVQYPRLLVVVGRNAELTLIDEYAGGSTGSDEELSHTNSVVEVYGLHDSRTRLISLQRHSSGTRSILTHRARLERGASMLTMPLAFGAAMSKQSYGVTLAGQGADSNIYGLLFGAGRQHLDNHTLHHHANGQTTSNINFKVVLRDKALSAYTGLIRIDQGAKVCEAYQENRNLLLSPGTRAETIPELEILNEEVSCSHGATIGPIDPQLVFYLKSRGIPEDVATRMVVSGFVASTLELVPEDLRQRVSGFVAQRLEDM